MKLVWSMRFRAAPKDLHFFAIAALAWFLTANFATATESYGSAGEWGLFYENNSAASRTCWAATASFETLEINGSPIYFSVTRHVGSAPSVIVYADQRLPKSAGLKVNVSGSSYRLGSSDGQFAYTQSEAADRKIIDDLKSLDKAGQKDPNDFFVSIPSVGNFSFYANGFNEALKQVLAKCSN
ncbi:hypothetical protein R5H32_16165 [Defluviimonas sp. D31]|uniref:hypothetical protein n=1 Tax=Defluviimonas sp. D31 TaxID=3083253 RepID=UPI00296E2E7F|nr:hypothetical protein [Defluviimonas sp. D31]MDW4550897.1 hypothetical protein [Defluviimonas sp. D31]